MAQVNWQQFTTASFARTQRYRKWNEICSETLCRMTIDPAERENFNSSLSRTQFGSLGLARMRTSGSRTVGGGETTSGWGSAGRDSVLLVLREAGHSVFEQDRGQFTVEPGDLFIHDLNKRAMFACGEDVEQIMIKVPYSALASRVPDPSELLGMSLSGKAPNVALAASIIRNVNRSFDEAIDSEWDHAVADLALDAIALLYKTSANCSEFSHDRSLRYSLRREAKGYIARHLTDPELNVSQLAGALDVSPRQLQRTFAEVGEVPSRYILEQRLRLAARMLSNLKGKSHGSIFEIALAAGFNDASHFCRTFSRRFGVSPKNFRGLPASSVEHCTEH